MSHALPRRRSRALASGAVLALALGLTGGVMSPASATPTMENYSNTSAITIPDFDAADPDAYVTSSIIVPADSGVAHMGDFAVTLHGLTHPWVRDLYVDLVSPAGTDVELLCRQPVAGNDSPDDAEVTFSSDGLGEANCLHAGYQTYLDDFTDENPAGEWTLYVQDVASDDEGSITAGFSIAFDEAAPTAASDPQNVSALAGTAATFTSTITGAPAPLVQWQVSEDGGGTWNDIYGADEASYTVDAPSLQENQNQYRAYAENQYNDVTTAPATLTVTGAAPGAPAMTARQTGTSQVTLQWTAPADTGSTAITRYVVHFPGGFPGEDYAYPATARSADLNNVSQGAHTFTIAAENAAGRSETFPVTLTVGRFVPDPPPPAPPAPARATPTLSVSKTDAVYGDRLTFTGTGQPGETVNITRVITGFRASGTSAVVDPTGHYTASAILTSSAVYQAKGATGLSSPSVFVAAKSKMSLAATRVAKRKYNLHGTVSPAQALQVVKLYYKKASGAYGLLGSVKTSSKGAWSYTHKYAATKKFTFKAVASAAEKNASNYRTLTVSVH